MTMQIVLRAKDGSVVLASDTLMRPLAAGSTSDAEPSRRLAPARGLHNATKVIFSVNHDVAVAFSGTDERGNDPAKKLANHLSEQAEIPDDPSKVIHILEKWGNGFFQFRYPGEAYIGTVCTLLVVIPRSPRCCAYKLFVSNDSRVDIGYTYLIAGDDNNAAIFWPQYFKCHKEVFDLQATTRIAACTILMAAEISFGVGGLELWQYENSWKAIDRKVVDAIVDDFKGFKETLHAAIIDPAPALIVDKSEFDAALRKMIVSKPTTFREVVAKPKPKKGGGTKRSAKKSG